MQLDEAIVDTVVKAACVLHNYVWDYDSSDMEIETQTAFGDSRQLGLRSAIQQRCTGERKLHKLLNVS